MWVVFCDIYIYILTCAISSLFHPLLFFSVCPGVLSDHVIIINLDYFLFVCCGVLLLLCGVFILKRELGGVGRGGPGESENRKNDSYVDCACW